MHSGKAPRNQHEQYGLQSDRRQDSTRNTRQGTAATELGGEGTWRRRHCWRTWRPRRRGSSQTHTPSPPPRRGQPGRHGHSDIDFIAIQEELGFVIRGGVLGLGHAAAREEDAVWISDNDSPKHERIFHPRTLNTNHLIASIYPRLS
jgi:hypothetical protein